MMKLKPGGSSIYEVISSDGVEVIDFPPDGFQDFCRFCRRDWGDRPAAFTNLQYIIKIRRESIENGVNCEFWTYWGV